MGAPENQRSCAFFCLSYHLKVVLNLDTEKSPFFLGLPKARRSYPRAISLAIHPQPWKKLHLHRDSGTPPSGPDFSWFSPVDSRSLYAVLNFLDFICCRARGFKFFICCRGYDSFLDFFFGGIFPIFVLDILEDKS